MTRIKPILVGLVLLALSVPPWVYLTVFAFRWLGASDRCAEHCFPFASKVEGPELECWCADLGDTWHPEGW